MTTQDCVLQDRDVEDLLLQQYYAKLWYLGAGVIYLAWVGFLAHVAVISWLIYIVSTFRERVCDDYDEQVEEYNRRYSDRANNPELVEPKIRWSAGFRKR